MSGQLERISERRTPEFLSVCTLVLWLVCSAVGATGLALPYPRPQPPVQEPEPIQAEVLNVEIAAEPLLLPDPEPPQNLSQPPLMIEPVKAAHAPPMIAVAEPSPAIAFALPVEGPTRVVDARNADYAPLPASALNAVMESARPPETLTFGRGDGKQPRPEYPAQAIRQGQEGTVTVRFSVGRDGRVLEVDASSPSPWPLLNQAAVRVIRERWRFRPGVVRLYEVSIHFNLKK